MYVDPSKTIAVLSRNPDAIKKNYSKKIQGIKPTNCDVIGD